MHPCPIYVAGQGFGQRTWKKKIVGTWGLHLITSGSRPRSLRSLAPLARSPLCYAPPLLRSLAPLARSPLCYARSSAPARSPLALLGGLAGAAGLPPRFARPPPRRVALPRWGSLVRPAPLRLAPWRPLSLRGMRVSPRAPPVPRGHPRPCVGRGLRPPPPSSPLLGAARPLSPSLSAVGVRVRPAHQPPTHSPLPPRAPRGGICAPARPLDIRAKRLGAQNNPRVRAIRRGAPVPLKGAPSFAHPHELPPRLKG